MANLRLPTTIRSIPPTERRPIRSMTRTQPLRITATHAQEELATDCYNTKTAVANHCDACTKKLAPHCYNTKGAVAKHRDMHNKTLAPHCYKRQQYQRCRSQRRVMINKTLAPYCYKDNINAAAISDASQSTRRLHRTATTINSSLNQSFPLQR